MKLNLAHEFFHYTNGGCIPTNNRKFLTEFISIYFQEYAKKYLMIEKGLTLENVLISNRIIDSLIMNKEFNSFCLILLAYEKLGNLSPNTPKEMKQILGMGDNTFETECLNLLKKINSNDDELEFYKYLTYQYPYLVGTILTYYALNNCEIKDIIKLNDSLNDPKYKDENIYELLKKFGIIFEDDLVYESINNMKKILKQERTKN